MAIAPRYPTPFDDRGLVTRPDADLMGVPTIQPWLGAPALSYPTRPPTVLDVVDRAVGLWPDRRFVVEAGGDERSVTFGQYGALVEGAAGRLVALGVGAGDTVAVAARNSLDLAVAHLACARIGAVLVGLNVRLAPEQWAYQLGHARVILALGAGELLDGLRTAGADAGLADDAVRALDGVFVGEPAPWAYDPATERPDEAATYAVVYTSGTTGRPKGSQVVHRASVHSGVSYQRALQLTGGDVHCVVFPLSYISAMHAHVLPALLEGSTVVLVAEPEPLEVADAVRRHRATFLYAVPSLWGRLARVPGFEHPGVGHLRLGAWGGAPMPGALLERLAERLPTMRTLEIYGLSETHSPATVLLDHEARRKPGSVGRPLPCMEAKVVDDDGAELGPGAAGELLVRGSLVTTGYLHAPEATATAIVDGWFRTGDVARRDAEGYVWILDRTKDMINRGGHKIFSAELERLLATHPAIREAAVLGMPDRAAGESVAVVLVAEPGAAAPPTAAEVRRFVVERYADYAAPRIVEVVDDLPRTTNGKVAKSVLRARLSGLAAGASPAPSAPT